ncbi:MAG: LPS export ABC transporter periplasmic protein LptC [Oligoflexia bacterium]|nr:LPS export ABC transporter periplasmic protein LptC [Oligoflexia bacterium]MBF0364257.1 LPS export ABC transporter periplasmic protein LptC [Oligoflexia bacterium]
MTPRRCLIKLFIAFKIRLVSYLFYLTSTITLCALCYYLPPSDPMDQSTSSEAPKSKSLDHRFNDVHYYVQKSKKPSLYLNAKELRINQQENTASFDYPKGIAYGNDGRSISYSANRGKIQLNNNNLDLYDNVYLYDDSSEIRSNIAKYTPENDYFEAIDNVRSKTITEKTKDKIYVNSNKAISWPQKKLIHYLGNVDGHIDRHLPYEPGIYFKSNKLFADANALYVELLENVYVKRATVEGRALRGEIFLDNYNKKLKYYALYDDVKLIERIPKKESNESTSTEVASSSANTNTKKENFIERRAYAEKLEGIVKEGKIVLTGYPKVIQEKDVVKGNKITFYENTELVEVDDTNSNLILKESKKQ